MTLILGIETSCDETAASVVRDGRTVLSNVIASQHALHEEYGGVVPEIASRAHAERISPVIERALSDAGVSHSELSAVAVGNRPGLIGSLLIGVSAAKALAWTLGVPVIGIDHLRAHLYAGLLDRDEPVEDTFPAIGLVVSGGHTSIYRCDDPLACELLGKTIDDAVGEAYDKVAMMLGLGHPGGPKVDELARDGDDSAHDFPVSRLAKDSLDFSFSGLKTSVLYTVRGKPRPNEQGVSTFERDASALNDSQIRDLCASFQRAVARAIVLKLGRALATLEERGVKPKTLLVGGGVSANSRLRAELTAFAEKHRLVLRLPAMGYCLDNAAMIAGLAHERLVRGDVDDLSLSASPVGSVA